MGQVYDGVSAHVRAEDRPDGHLLAQVPHLHSVASRAPPGPPRPQRWPCALARAAEADRRAARRGGKPKARVSPPLPPCPMPSRPCEPSQQQFALGIWDRGPCKRARTHVNGACGGASLHSVVPATAEQQVRVLGVELKREDTVGVPRLGLAPATAAAAHPCAFVARCLCPASWPSHRSRSTTNAESREVVARSSGGRGSQYHSVCVCVLVASSYTRTCTCAAGANEPKTEGNNRIRSRTAVSASRLSSKLLWESAVATSGHRRCSSSATVRSPLWLRWQLAAAQGGGRRTEGAADLVVHATRCELKSVGPVVYCVHLMQCAPVAVSANAVEHSRRATRRIGRSAARRRMLGVF